MFQKWIGIDQIDTGHGGVRPTTAGNSQAKCAASQGKTNFGPSPFLRYGWLSGGIHWKVADG